MKKILVIGCNGQLGNKIRDNQSLLPNADFQYVDIDKLDISKIEEVDSFFEKNSFDVVINCAAYTAVEKAEDDIENARLANAVAPQNLAKCSKKYGYKLIHVSTDYVFDGKANTPYSEDFATNPLSVYGKTKLEGEKNITAENCGAVIVRTAWLYSEYGNNYVKTMIRLGSEGKIKGVVYDQTGTPTYAGDLAKALISISRLYINENIWHEGIYHFTNRGVCSWYDFTMHIFELTNIKANVKPLLTSEYPTKATRPTYSVLNTSKISSTFNIEIPYWTDSLREMLENFSKLNP
ncbi:MAG: dTDP-4-dehydrorhamnose reductase [Bacteroidales bacterium]|nr:dTDP-4-dehydrorhamnose reductase [Bacteroidales bacterium]